MALALPNEEHTPRRLLPRSEVLHRTGLKNTGLYGLIKAGLFPRPVKLSPEGRRVAWDSQAVNEWIEARIAASRPTREEAER